MNGKHNSRNNMWFIIAYLVPILTGVIAYVAYADKDRRIKFQAAQAILYGIGVVIVYYLILVLFSLAFFRLPDALFIPNFALFLMWLYGLYVGYRAFSGAAVSIPVAGEMATRA